MCLFCDKISNNDFKVGSEYCAAFFDNYPVTKYHMLIIPKRHVETFFDLTIEERNDIFKIVDALKVSLSYLDPTITGWNIGFNCGESAGQTINHCHCHLIPRRDNDCDDPIGGVRGCIPAKMNYLKNNFFRS